MDLLTTKESRRGAILQVEEIMKSHPDAVGPDFFKTVHMFLNGQYIRSTLIPAGTLITTKIHKQEHPMFLMKGKATIFSEDGIRHIEAPFHAITKAGTKRIVYMDTETLCITVHRTDANNVPDAEADIYAESFEEMSIPYIKGDL